MKYINAAHSSKSGKVLTAQKLRSGDILITADSHETKSLIELENRGTKVIAGKTKVKRRQFTVMAHANRTYGIKTANQEKALTELQAQNLQLRNKIKFLKLAWKKKTLTDSKLHRPLRINVGTREEANTLAQEGLVHDHELKNCEIVCL